MRPIRASGRVPRVRGAFAISGLAALFAAGALLAGTGIARTTATTDAAVTTDTAAATDPAADTTTEVFTTTESVTTTEITTEPAAAPVTTTVERTTTRRVIVPVTTTSNSSSSSDTPTWVWVLIGVLAAGIGALVFLLASRGGRTHGASALERRRRLDGAVGTWAAQGWAVDSQTGESAVLRRGSELMLVTVDEVGHVNTRPLDPGSHPAT